MEGNPSQLDEGHFTFRTLPERCACRTHDEVPGGSESGKPPSCSLAPLPARSSKSADGGGHGRSCMVTVTVRHRAFTEGARSGVDGRCGERPSVCVFKY